MSVARRNRYTDLVSVVQTVEFADEVWLPFLLQGKYRPDLLSGARGPRNEAVLHRFLMKSG